MDKLIGLVSSPTHGAAPAVAAAALTRAAHKLPMKCRIVRREAGDI